MQLELMMFVKFLCLVLMIKDILGYGIISLSSYFYKDIKSQSNLINKINRINKIN